MRKPIYPDRFQPKRSKTKQVTAACILLALILGNTGVALAYHGRTYSHAAIGDKRIGSVTYPKFLAQVKSGQFVGRALTITFKGASGTMSMSELGASLDTAQAQQAMRGGRAWPPMLNFVTTQHITLPIVINDAVFKTGLATLQKQYEKAPTPAHLTQEDYIFVVKPATRGITLDRAQFRQQLTEALQTGRTTIELPIVPSTPGDLQVSDQQYGWDQLKLEQNTAITYMFTQKTKQLTAREVGMWYVPKGDTYELSDDKIKATIIKTGADFGITVENVPQALAATKEAIQTHQSLAFSFLTTTPAQ